jgi:predicted AAA+ superfamily ATPase
MTRGNRSGRVAWQFIQHMAGQQGKNLNWEEKNLDLMGKNF